MMDVSDDLQRTAIDKHFFSALLRASRGKLARSILFDQITVVWSLAQRPERWKYDKPADHEPGLAERLLAAVRAGDTATLQEATDVLAHLNQFTPRRDEIYGPADRLDRALSKHFHRRCAGTIEELLDKCCREMQWVIGETNERKAYDKQIRRACKRLGFVITKSKPGPK
jgi:hypothetical protein